MSPASDRDYLVKALTPLCEPLHRNLLVAHDLADGHFREHDMTGPQYAAARSHLTRSHARRLLHQDTLKLGGWIVPATRSNTKLTIVQGTLSLRLLRPDPGGEIPHPGNNQKRIEYYRNNDLNLLGVAGSSLLGMWEIDEKAHKVGIRIVRPVGAWKYGKHARVDVDFYLPTSSETLASLEFRPEEDNELMLPSELDVDLAEGEDDGGPQG